MTIDLALLREFPARGEMPRAGSFSWVDPFDKVIQARRMSGPGPHHAVAVADVAAYERFMTRRLATLPGLGELQSRFAMKTLKVNM